MWANQHTIETDASPEAVWQVWVDVNNWPQWDEALEWCKLEGDFAKGSVYSLKPEGGPEVKATITECEPLKRFSDVTSLPLAKMSFSHEMVPLNGRYRLTHQVRIWGPLSFLFARVIGKKTVHEMPKAMENLIRLAKGVENRE